MSYTKNLKPQTTFELIVPNEDSPGFYTKESVLIVGAQAEPFLERLEAGDEVELTGKLQRGQVVCFKVHVRQSAIATAGVTTQDGSPEYQSEAVEVALPVEAPSVPATKKARKPNYSKASRLQWPAAASN
jgi:hypothetical protein